MNYEFLSREDAGTDAGDYILALRTKPNWLQRLLGRRAKRVAFYGHANLWYAVDGSRLRPRMDRLLQSIWQEHKPADAI